MIKRILHTVFANLKNSFGWKTNRKIIVFSVDDYGNVRLNSKAARANLDKAGMKIYSRFDALDTLETKQDLEQLFEVLNSVKDKNGRNAVFTPFALPCNINFEKVEENNFQKFEYETLPETYSKLAIEQPEAYFGAWEKWQEGIQKGFLKPQFHGREHVNLSIFNDKLKNKDEQIITALKNKSYTSISDDDYPTKSSFAAFDFWDVSENQNLKSIVIDGLQKFEEVFGYKSNYFTPPVFNIHHSLFPTLKQNGVNFIDLALYRKEHQGFGKYKNSLNYTGKKTNEGLTIMVRNVVFEPTEDRGIDWIDFTLKQIETAFRWNKPAIISSHRVNFCGHIDEKNREKGLKSLESLLQEIVKKWPDVEFMSADELGNCIVKK
ncbi:hypothetical protein [Flavobacterium macrobrachii]|uniref:Polysaccharide (De)acetylase n=1 Tax=Flavobacterium macrobrachii TaxID=591204 RepID=A0ABS2CXZ2_9FLAO|nr:hypothetical protein [Flavobacterium macrobrachii]MBM6499837.1 hypothetical protein [Flavobacterium macrobrachii]